MKYIYCFIILLLFGCQTTLPPDEGTAPFSDEIAGRSLNEIDAPVANDVTDAALPVDTVTTAEPTDSIAPADVVADTAAASGDEQVADTALLADETETPIADAELLTDATTDTQATDTKSLADATTDTQATDTESPVDATTDTQATDTKSLADTTTDTQSTDTKSLADATADTQATDMPPDAKPIYPIPPIEAPPKAIPPIPPVAEPSEVIPPVPPVAESSEVILPKPPVKAAPEAVAPIVALDAATEADSAKTIDPVSETKATPADTAFVAAALPPIGNTVVRQEEKIVSDQGLSKEAPPSPTIIEPNQDDKFAKLANPVSATESTKNIPDNANIALPTIDKIQIPVEELSVIAGKANEDINFNLEGVGWQYDPPQENAENIMFLDQAYFYSESSFKFRFKDAGKYDLTFSKVNNNTASKKTQTIVFDIAAGDDEKMTEVKPPPVASTTVAAAVVEPVVNTPVVNDNSATDAMTSTPDMMTEEKTPAELPSLSPVSMEAVPGKPSEQQLIEKWMPLLEKRSEDAKDFLHSSDLYAFDYFGRANIIFEMAEKLNKSDKINDKRISYYLYNELLKQYPVSPKMPQVKARLRDADKNTFKPF